MKAQPSIQSLLAGTGFLVWLLGILAMQVNTLYTAATGRRLPGIVRWKRFDVLGLCPRFSFFNWLPSVHYHLLYRDVYRVGRAETEYTPWRLVPLPGRSYWRLVWNPQRRSRFVVEDACRAILAQLGNQVQQRIAGRDPFEAADPRCLALTCLQHHVASLPVSPLTETRQLLIAQSRTMDSPSVSPVPLYVSGPFQPLPVLR